MEHTESDVELRLELERLEVDTAGCAPYWLVDRGTLPTPQLWVFTSVELGSS